MLNLGALRRRRTVLETVLVAVLVGVWALALTLSAATPARLISNFGLIAAAGTAALACAGAALRWQGRARVAWWLFSAAMASWACGQATWTWYEEVVQRTDLFPSLADVGYLLAVPFAVAALLAVLSGGQGVAGRARTVIDGLMIGGSMLLISWVLVLGPALGATFTSGLEQAILLAYPLGDVVVVTMALFVMVRNRQSDLRLHVPVALLAMGLIAIAVSDSGFAYLELQDAYASGALIDAGWFTGFALIAAAAVRPVGHGTVGAAPTRAAPSLELLLPYVAVVAAVAVAMVHYARSGQLDAGPTWILSGLLLLTVGRQVLTLLENLALTRDLEARVERRTAQLRASERRFAALVEHSSDVLTVVDRESVVTYQSDSVYGVFGYRSDQLLGRPLTGLLPPDAAATLRRHLDEVAGRPAGMVVFEVPVLHADGHTCIAEMIARNLLDDPLVGGLVVNTRDVTERRSLEDRLVHSAFHDALTSLANRTLFTDRIAHALSRRDLPPAAVAMLFLDLDGFKEVNDSLGHAAGDLLLIRVADRLRSSVRPGDTVARFGGDEFAVLLEDDDAAHTAITVAERIRGQLAETFTVDGQELQVRASIGIAVSGPDVDSADQLLRNADLAMYRAKSRREGGYEYYDPEMHRDLVERLQLEADLRRALERDELHLLYQPTLELASEEIVGVEALLRWRHPTHGWIPPGTFVPIAESIGLVREIGAWVLREACRQATGWRGEQRDERLTMSVNISARQLSHGCLIQDVATALAASGLPADQLVLEMTESVLMTDTEENLRQLRQLKDLGVRVAIDDFGTGYSSLSYLQRFPVDVLKIDRSFVERLSSSEDAELVGAIVRLGHSLEIDTVAEGIEDETQLAALQRLRCGYGQGFYFSRPVPAHEISRMLGLPVVRARSASKAISLDEARAGRSS